MQGDTGQSDYKDLRRAGQGLCAGLTLASRRSCLFEFPCWKVKPKKDMNSTLWLSNCSIECLPSYIDRNHQLSEDKFKKVYIVPFCVACAPQLWLTALSLFQLVFQQSLTAGTPIPALKRSGQDGEYSHDDKNTYTFLKESLQLRVSAVNHMISHSCMVESDDLRGGIETEELDQCWIQTGKSFVSFNKKQTKQFVGLV